VKNAWTDTSTPPYAFMAQPFFKPTDNFICVLIRIGETRNAYRLLGGKPGGKRALGRSKRRWVDNIRMDLGEVGWGDVDWIGLAQDGDRWTALVNSVMNFRVP
jgi:hypothetical protein